MSESQIHTSFKVFTDARNRSISNRINTVISIVATDDNTIIYYDHWEDGYESNLENPSSATTKIWGDNNNANGKPPGYTTDIINVGDVISLENEVYLPRNSSSQKYDGRDKIGATAQLAVSRAAWAPNPGPVLSGAVEILETSAWGQDFEIPIGENIIADDIFDYVSLVVMAKHAATFVQIDTDGDGNNDLTRWLNEGEVYQVDGGINAGAKIIANQAIQAHLITGDIGGLFENRWFTLFPCELWDNSYFSPIGTTVATDPVNVFIYNPNNSTIQVQYNTLGNAGSFNIGAKAVYRFSMPVQSGAHFYTNDGSPFFAIGTIDSDVQHDNDAHDWGFTLVPESYLTVSATIGWGPGSGDGNGNGSPGWVTAIQPTTIYVDYDGNPTTGPNTDSKGNQYDVAYNISAYESLRIYDNSDNDQTGMFIYTLDGTLISAAWGQDPATAAPGNPFLDFGTTVPPIRNISAWKEYELTTDDNNNGLVDQGDIITFTIHIQNAGNSPIYDINLKDTLPSEVTYIANSTRLNGYLIVDNNTGTAFPLDEAGYDKASLAVNETDVYSFECQVNNPPPTITTLTNRFTAVIGTPNKTLTGEVTVPVVGSTVTVEFCNLNFTNNGGSIQSTYVENEEICITVSDNDQNTNISSTQDIEILVVNGNTGDRETVCLTETGNNTGIFKGCIGSSASGGIGVEDGTLNAVGGNLLDATFTDPIYGEVCTNTVIISAPTETKVLYLTDGQGLDRIDPAATNDNTTASIALGSSTLTKDTLRIRPSTKDAWIQSQNPTAMGGELLTTVVGMSGINEARAPIEFDLSAIPSGATVVYAELLLEVTGPAIPAAPFQVDIHRITTSWVESTVNWNVIDTNWDTNIEASTDIGPLGEYTWNITSLISNWKDGTYNNYGLLVKANNPTTDVFSWIAPKEHATDGYRPELRIGYITGNNSVNSGYKRKLTFSNDAQTENLTNFPVLIKLDNTRIDYANTQNNGEDLRFYDADGTTPLSYDIEEWNESGTSYVWVKVPQIDGASNTDYIWMHYGDATASDGQDVSGTWNSGYQGVWHLDETSGNHIDATQNNNDGVAEGSINQNTTGLIGGTNNFDGVDDRVDIPNNIITGITDFTLSAWIKTSTTGVAQPIIQQKDQAVFWNVYNLQVDSGTDKLKFVVASQFDFVSSNVVTDGQWHYVTAVRDGINGHLYINGVLDQSVVGNSIISIPQDVTVWIGGNERDSRFFDGLIDEPRISNSVRSANWIAAQYASMSDAFVTFGTEESIGGGSSSNAFLTAVDDNESTAINTTLTTTNVITNDIDAESETISVIDFTQASNGTVVNNGNGTFNYTPNLDYTGSDNFDYLIIDAGSDMTHHWGLNGNGTDDAGTANGTVNGTTTVAGAFGDALSFNESATDYVQIPDFSYNNEYTITFDFKVDDNTGSLFQYIYSHGNVNSTNSVNIFLLEDTHGTDPNQLRTVIRDTDDALDNFALAFDASTLIGDGLWHTYTLTVNSSGSTVYLDGIQQAFNATFGGDSFNPTGSLYLGIRDDLDADRCFGGSLDNVQVYGLPLSTDVIMDLNNETNRGTVKIYVGITVPNSGIFTQSIPMCTDLEMPAGGQITISNYINTLTGSIPANPDITAILKKDNTILATLTNPTYLGTASTGYGTSIAASAGSVISLTNLLSAPDNLGGQLFADGDYVIIELENEMPIGSSYSVYARIACTGATPFYQIEESSDNSTFYLNSTTPRSEASAFFTEHSYVSENPTRYIRITKTSGACMQFDAIKYSIAAQGNNTLQWTGILPSDVSIDAGSTVSLEITQNDAGYSFEIEYDSDTKPSQITLPVTTVIEIEELAIYDAPYPKGNLTQSLENGQTGYIRATVSDPFGPYDITGLDLNIYPPSGSSINLNLDEDDVAGISGCNKIYEYVWKTSVEQGQFSIEAIAKEGYEGITDSLTSEVEVSFKDEGTSCDVQFTNSGFDPTDTYNADDQICMEVTDIDKNEDSLGIETVNIKLTGTGDTETVTLTETGINTGVFQGCINSNSILVGTSENGQLYAPTGSLINLEYTDTEDSTDICEAVASINTATPTLQIQKTLIEPTDGTALLGDFLQFDILLVNTGGTTLTSVALSDVFDNACMSYDSASIVPNTIGTGTLDWTNVGPMTSGESQIISVYFTAASSCNPAQNTASASGVDENSTPVSAGPVTAEVIITNPSISITKTLIIPASGPFFEYDILAFQIDITNTGNTNIAVLPLEDVFSGYCFEFQTASITPDGYGNGNIIWNDLGALNVGNTISLTTQFSVANACDPAINEAIVAFAIDENGDVVPTVMDEVQLSIESPPVAIDDDEETFPGVPVTVSVLDNDYDINDNIYPGSVTTTDVLQPTNGSITSINPITGAITYTPDISFLGIDTYEYIVCDSTNLCDTALVTITIKANLPPNAVDDYSSTLIDVPVDIAVLDNDSDPDDGLDTTSIATTGLLPPTNGGISTNTSTGVITYTPNSNYTGQDSFEYQICDVAGACDTATVYIIIRPCIETPGQNDITGIVFQDVNGNGVYDDQDNGRSAVTVSLYEDENGDGHINGGDTFIGTDETDINGVYTFAAAPSFGGTVTYEDIPSSGININSSTACGGTPITRTITVAESMTINDVNFGFNANHAYRGDVEVTLRSPQGTTVTLIVGGGNDNELNYDLLLDDASGGSIHNGSNDNTASPYYDRTVNPDNSLNAFNGQNAAGIWTISICDDYPSVDDGQYFRSQLNITGTGTNEVRYVMTIDEDDLPSNASMSTDNEETVLFTAIGQSDCANDFGYVVPSSLVLNAVVSDVNCIGDPIGTIDLTVSGGILPYQYTWSNGATVEDLSGLTAGIYTVTVIDNLGVFAGMNVTVNAPDPMTCPEICGDGIDNDGDNLIDSFDPDCCDNITDAGTIGSDEENCGSFVPATMIELSAPMDGTGTIYYQWQIYNGTWMDIPSATSISYSPGNITTTTQYRRGVHRVGCSDWLYSNAITKTVISNHTNAGTITGDEITCGSYDPMTITSTLAPSGGSGGTEEYQWQYDDGSGWMDMAGTNSATYDPPLITQTTQYRRRVRLSPCTAWIATNIVVKTVESVPVAAITTAPSGSNGWLCEMTDYIFEAADAGVGATYSWNFGANANPTSATGIGPHTIEFIASNDSTAFSPEVILIVNQNGCEDQDTTNFNIHPLPIITTATPINPNICNVSNGTIEVTVTGEQNLCFEVSLDGGTTWEANNETIFNGLSGGSYYLVIRYCNMDCPNPYGLIVLSDPAAVVAVNDSFSLCPGANFNNTVVTNDTNIVNAIFTVLGTPLYGSVTLEPNGTFSYTSTSTICGTDQFSYQVCDPTASCCSNAIVYLTFEDYSIPTLVNIPENDTISCDEEIPMPPQIFAFDNCPSIGISVTEESTQGEDGCSQYDYAITRTWTATDHCGNSTSDSQIVEVQDVVAPDIFRIYTLPNGKKMVAGVMEYVGKNWKTVNLPIDFDTKPLILHQVITNNEATALVSQIQNTSVSQFELSIQEEENSDQIHTRESIAWIAMEPGLQSTDYQLEMESTFLSDAQLGITFQNTFAAVPALFASSQTTNETDPFSIRHDILTNAGMDLNIQEETSSDAEIIHTNEVVGYLALENIGDLRDEKGILIGEVGTTTLTDAWTTINLTNNFHNPVVIANCLSSSDGAPATVRVRNVDSTSFEVSIEEWEYLDGNHGNETLSFLVIEGSIPLESPVYCDTGVDSLEIGIDFKAVDNCDVNVIINYSEEIVFIDAKKIIQRTWAAVDECGNSTSYTQKIVCEGVSLKIKSVLQGAMIGNDGDGLMRDDLRRKGLLPLEEPYSSMNHFQHVGEGGGEIADTALFLVEGANGIVDWVFLELRDPNDKDNVVATVSGLIQRDGDIISVQGDSIIHFLNIPVGDYYVAVRHRNHLGISSLNTYTFSPTTSPFIDFSFDFTPVGGSNPTIEMDDLQSMWSGDLNCDGKIIYQGPNNDAFYMFLHILLNEENTNSLLNYISKGYTPDDFNLDGSVIYQGPNNDKSNLLFNTILSHPNNPQKLSNFIISIEGN